MTALTPPMATIAASVAMNRYVGSKNVIPDSRVPRRFTIVSTKRIARQSATVCGRSAGAADTSAPTPAEMPTATFKM